PIVTAADNVFVERRAVARSQSRSRTHCTRLSKRILVSRRRGGLGRRRICGGRETIVGTYWLTKKLLLERTKLHGISICCLTACTFAPPHVALSRGNIL